MYKVETRIKTKRAINGDFKDQEEAMSFIKSSIEKQYSFCVRGWGLTTYTTEQKGDTITATYSSVIAFVKPLIVRFKLIRQ